MKDLIEFAKLKGEPNKLEKDYQLQPKATATSRVRRAKANKKRKRKALMDKDMDVTNKKSKGSESPQDEKLEMPAQQATNDLTMSDLTKVKAEPSDEEDNQPQNPKAPVDARAVRTRYYDDWREEFPAHIAEEYEADKKAKRPMSPVEMNRRHTYKRFQPEPAKDVIQFEAPYPERLEDPNAYVRSLARYTRDLGPTAWKIASKKIDPTDEERNREAVPKIDSSLPSVEANKPIPTTPPGPTPNDHYGLSDEMVEAIRRFNDAQPDPPQRSNNVAPLSYFLPHQHQMPPFPFPNMPFPNYFTNLMNSFNMVGGPADIASQKGFATYEPAGAYQQNWGFGQPSSSNARGLQMPQQGNRTSYAPAGDLSLKMNSNVVVPSSILKEDSSSDEEER